MTETMSRSEYRALARDEHTLQATVLRHMAYGLTNSKIFYFGIPNAAKRSFQLAARMKKEGLTAGIADICIMMPAGKTCWLELKTMRKGSRQSADQIDFALRCKDLGHPYAVAHNIDEAIARLRKWKVIR